MHCILSVLLSACLLISSLFPTSKAIPQQLSKPCGNWCTTLLSTSEAAPQQPPTTEEVSVSAPSVALMEASTGQIIYEKDAHTSLHPASITKIMTMILIFDALEQGKISLEDTVTVSEYAASMGGSQVFLEQGETQTVETMLKCISVASANDACVSFIYSRH